MALTFLTSPHWLLPDQVLLFAFCVFVALGQAGELLRRLAPFTALLAAYQLSGSIPPALDLHVNYQWMIDMDRLLVGSGRLPTEQLQDVFWRGAPSWYDYLYYATYMSHFVWPAVIVVVAWKLRPHEHKFVIRCYLLLTGAGFVTYLLFPAAPPWMASDEGLISPITRVSSHVYAAMDIAPTTTLWADIPPNPVAAVPSLHAGYAVLLFILVWRLFGARWGVVVSPYPVIILVGTVYAGEHYAIDELLGALYAVAAVVVLAWGTRGTLDRVPQRVDPAGATPPNRLDEVTVEPGVADVIGGEVGGPVGGRDSAAQHEFVEIGPV